MEAPFCEAIQVSKCTRLTDYTHLYHFPPNGANFTHLPPDPNVITERNTRFLIQKQTLTNLTQQKMVTLSYTECIQGEAEAVFTFKSIKTFLLGSKISHLYVKTPAELPVCLHNNSVSI